MFSTVESSKMGLTARRQFIAKRAAGMEIHPDETRTVSPHYHIISPNIIS
jgi:hypothetical protein